MFLNHRQAHASILQDSETLLDINLSLQEGLQESRIKLESIVARGWHIISRMCFALTVSISVCTQASVADSLFFKRDDNSLDDNSIWRASSNGSGVIRIVEKGVNDFGLPDIEFNHGDGMLYWPDHISIRRSNIYGENIEVLAQVRDIDWIDAHTLEIVGTSILWREATEDFSIGLIDLSAFHTETQATTYQLAASSYGDVEFDETSNSLFLANQIANWGSGPSCLPGTIEKVELGSGNTTTLASGFAPGALEIDAIGGHLYWSEFTRYPGCFDDVGGIYRSNLDGSNVEELIDGPIFSFTLDLQGRQLYFATGVEVESGDDWIAKSVVRRASLHGRDSETLFEVDFPVSNLTFAAGVAAGSDCNGDGRLNANDLTCVSSIEDRDAVLTGFDIPLGDIDGDGIVAFTDFLTLSENFVSVT